MSLTHQHELQRAMITNVDSDKAQSHRLKSSAEATGGSDNGITNLESAGAMLQQERALIVNTSVQIRCALGGEEAATISAR